MSAAHTTFGVAEVLTPAEDGRHHVIERANSVFVDVTDLRGVVLRFGWENEERPYCGKCRHGLRAVVLGDGRSIWVSDDGPTRQPYCPETIEDDELGDAELVEQMWHEPDRSVGSWCRGAAIHVDDDSGALRFVARTERHKVVVDVRRLPDGEVHVQTVRKRRRRNREAS
jgi:hypothetical protein